MYTNPMFILVSCINNQWHCYVKTVQQRKSQQCTNDMEILCLCVQVFWATKFSALVSQLLFIAIIHSSISNVNKIENAETQNPE